MSEYLNFSYYITETYRLTLFAFIDLAVASEFIFIIVMNVHQMVQEPLLHNIRCFPFKTLTFTL